MGIAGETAGGAGSVGRWVALLAPLTAVLCYVNADHEEFLFDSAGTAIRNPTVASVPAAARALLRRPWAPSQEVTDLSFAINRSIWAWLAGGDGFDATGFLVGNVLIHAINSWLVFLLLRGLLTDVSCALPVGSPPNGGVGVKSRSAGGSRRDGVKLGGADWIALGVALIFAAHPLHASSVVYLIQRRGALATTFYLASVLAYLRWRGESTRWKAIGWAAMVLACAWASMKSKAMGMTLPVALLWVEICLRVAEGRRIRRVVGWSAIGCAAWAASSLAYLSWLGAFSWSDMRLTGMRVPGMWGPWVHFLTEARAFWAYWKLIWLPWPGWMCIDHDFPLSQSLGEHGAWLAVVMHGVVLGVATWALRRRQALAAMGMGWFYVALLPYVASPQVEVMVEYKTYLASVGAAMIGAWGMGRLCWVLNVRGEGDVSPPNRGLMAGVSMVVIALMVTTLLRNRIYHNGVSLWSDAVAKYPGAPRPHNALGSALISHGRVAEGLREFEETLRIAPEYSAAHLNLGSALAELRRFAEAESHLRKVIEINPVEYGAEARVVLGTVLSEQGRLEEAVEELSAGLSSMSDNASGLYNLGNALTRLGRIDEAIAAYRRALEIEPRYLEASVNLGISLELADRIEDAVLSYRGGLERLPERPNPDTMYLLHSKLAGLLQRRGDLAEALTHYELALEYRPGDVMCRAAREACRSGLGRR